MFHNNIALNDFFSILKKVNLWAFLGYFDLKLKYRRAFLGPWWVVIGMAISAGLMCMLWSTIFNLDWKEYLSYLFSGFIIWIYISNQISESPEIFFKESARLIKSYPNPPLFYVFRKCFLNLLVFMHHIPLIIIICLFVQTDFNIRTVLTMPIGILLVFLNFIFLSSILGILAARFKDIDPTVKALMPPMLLLTPVLWNPEMLGEFSYFIYFNPFTYFISVIRNDLIGLSFDIYIWLGMIFITIINLVIFIILYHKKRNRIIFWI